MNKFARGSEWRKWDLHVHTPYSICQKFGADNEVTWEKYIKNLEDLSDDFAVIGVNDYFFIDGYKKLKNEQDKNSRLQKIKLFPVVEFRIEKFAGIEFDRFKRINLHVIFSDDVSIDTINSQFLNTLDQSYCLKNGDVWERTITMDSVTELGAKIKKSIPKEKLSEYGSDLTEGFNNLNIKEEQIFKSLKKDCFKDKYLVAIGKTEWDSLKWTDSSIATKKSIINQADIVFTAAESTVKFEKAKNKLTENEVNDLLLDCSDAHSFSDSTDKDRIGNCFTWIKADPTFEGLKQILCEPKDRVKIQANKPEEKSGYHVIKAVEIDSHICKQNILLNPNLNTIIGGRSTGKSTLLQLIAYRVNPSISDIKQFITDIPQETIKIIWQDDAENKDRDIEFFPQSHMHEIARDKEKKNKLIQDIVKEKDDKSLIKNYERFCANNKSTIQTNLDDLFNLQKYIDELTVTLKEKGDESGLKKEIENIQTKINNSQQDNSFSEDELKQYEELKEQILKLDQSQQKQERDKNEITALKEESLFDSSFIYKFNQLSESNSQAIQEIFAAVRQNAIKEWQDKLSAKLTEIDELIEKYKTEIQNKKESSVFKKGNDQLEQNKQYKELNERLAIENKKLAEITSLKYQINKIKKQKEKLFEETVRNHIDFSTKIDDLINEFSLVHDDIEIKIKKRYQRDKSEGLLKDFINLQSHDRKSFVNDWGDNYEADPKLTITDFLQQALENGVGLKAYKEIKDLTKGLLTENWFSVSYELTYQNDTFNEMSDGKKAFVILKLLLEFSHKECPILIDQPEDSLDNRAIYNELVAYLKKKKKDRQIILVTHNANIVVNADAEEVIVANQHGENSKNQDNIQFQYITGSLENTKSKETKQDIVLQSQGIREHVCEILEGGTEAFKKRENKYGIAKDVFS